MPAESLAAREGVYRCFWEVAKAEEQEEGDPGLTCPANLATSAWLILEDELEWDPFWESAMVEEAKARDAILCLTRWLTEACERLLTGDNARARSQAERFVPLDARLRAQFPDGLDVDACYWRLRAVLGDHTADANRRAIEELGGNSGLWRSWVAVQLELLEAGKVEPREST